MDALDGLIEKIAFDSLRIYERAALPNFASSFRVNPCSKIEERCREWFTCLGGAVALEQRLHLLDVSFEDMPNILSDDGVWCPSHLLPAWTDMLKKAIEAAQGGSWRQTVLLGVVEENRKKIAFSRVYLPLLMVVYQNLTLNAHTSRFLSENAKLDILNHALLLCHRLSSRSIFLEYSARLVYNRNKGPVPDSFYDDFQADFLENGFAHFFSEYASLARILCTSLMQWIDYIHEVIDHLSQDESWIAKDILGEEVLPPIKNIHTAGEDVHLGGRKVLVLTLESGQKIVYKPRTLHAEQAFAEYLEQAAELGLGFNFKSPRMIVRENYGWAEFISQEPCVTKNEVHDYYRRAGALACLLMFLNGSDLHNENLIAHGSYPVLVDNEVLFDPVVYPMDISAEEKNFEILLRKYSRSVLMTGLLPHWKEIAGIAYDSSSLSAVGNQMLKRSNLKWSNIGQTNIALEVERGVVIRVESKENEVIYQGQIQDIDAYLEDIIAGFEQAFKLVAEKKATFIAQEGPIYRFEAFPLRYVYRNTRLYMNILYASFSPSYLRSGVDRSLFFERMFKGVFSQTNGQQKIAAVAQREIESMENGDVPYFSSFPQSRSLWIDRLYEIPDFFDENGMSDVLKNFEATSEKDCVFQTQLIYTSLFTRRANNPHQNYPERVADEPHSILDPSEFREEARTIGRILIERAVRGRQHATWVDLVSDPLIERYIPRPSGFDLYSGLSGVAFFFSALYRTFGEEVFKEYALAAIKPIRDKLHSSARRSLISKMGIGGGTGAASIVYAFVKMADMLSEPNLIEEASRVSEIITVDKIGQDERFDVIGGAAGTLLCLMSLYEITRDIGVFQALDHCVDRLALTAKEISDGAKVWYTFHGTALTGFAHGNAGIAYALGKFGANFNDLRSLSLMKSAIAFEAQVFDEQRNNWPDFRSDQLQFMTAWCHGAAGIAMSRAGLLRYVSDDQIRIDAQIGLNTVADYKNMYPDHLCCGALGRAEALLTGGMVLKNERYINIARQIASFVVKNAASKGGFTFHNVMPTDMIVSGFHQGLAGIGYTLIRMASPDTFPNVLLWD